jgi:hypothetical protein
MPNCWSIFFPVLPKIDGCQIDLANSWRCGKIIKGKKKKENRKNEPTSWAAFCP